MQWYVAHSVLVVYEVNLRGGIGWQWAGVLQRHTGEAVGTGDLTAEPQIITVTRADERTVTLQGALFAEPVRGDWQEIADGVRVVRWVAASVADQGFSLIRLL